MKDKIFLACIIVAFSVCSAFISTSIVDTLDNTVSAHKDNFADNKSVIQWEYATMTIRRGEDCGFSDMINDGWLVIGAEIGKDDATYLIFRRPPSKYADQLVYEKDRLR